MEAWDAERKQVFEYVGKYYKTIPEYPWDDLNAVLRRSDNRKWYGVVLRVERRKLGLDGDGEVDVINLKEEPFFIGSLRMKEGFHPAYHMNKEKWISVRLDGSVPQEEIRNLIDLSYELTAPKKAKRH